MEKLARANREGSASREGACNVHERKTPTFRPVYALASCLFVLIAAKALAATSRPADSRAQAGIVERAQGEVRIERNGLVIENVTAGHPITRRDNLVMGAGSRVMLVFSDGSRLAVGENALLIIADYMREDGRRSGALILDLLRGAIRLVAAKPKEAPDKRIEVRTAAATISSQGVDLWSGPVDDKLAVLVLQGRIDVRNDAGLVMLDRKRLGTFVSDRLRAPEKPTLWPAHRARESLMTVAFK